MTEVRQPSSRAERKKPEPQSPPAPALPPPKLFKPHRRLFAILGVILFAWLAVLLVLYFTTVYPYRHTRVEYPGEKMPANR